MWWLGLLVLAGCGRIAFDDRATDARADAPPCTPSGHDEDGDSFDDSCDVCPHIADAQNDGDGDRVGDVCDPNVAVPSERIVFFDPFTVLRPEWKQIGNAVPVYTGEAIAQDLPTTRLAMAVQPATQRGVVQLGTHVMQPGTLPRQIVIVAHEGPTRLIYCEIFDAGSANLAVTYSPDNQAFTPLAQAQTQAITTGELTLVMRHALPAVTCATTWPAPVQQVTAAVPDGNLVASDISIAVQGAFWTLDYYIQIATE